MKNLSESEGNQLLQGIKEKGKEQRFCVLGAGNGGMAMAAHLAIMGFRVNLYNRTPARLQSIIWHGGIQLSGAMEGFGKIEVITSDISEALEGVDILMVTVPATAHSFIARICAPCLKDGQIIILNPGRTGGVLEFRKILSDLGMEKKIFLGETQTFIYASRTIGPAKSRIFRIKNEVTFATLPSYWIPGVLTIIRQAFPEFVPGDNILKTSLDNIGAVFHPALTIFNVSWIEETKGGFDFYLDGLSPSLALLLEEVDRERIAVAAALGIKVNSAREWLYQSYGSYGENLYTAIQFTTAYRGVRAPESIDHRYIWEDVPASLVPIVSIGEMLGVPCPMIKTLIYLASVLQGKDYWREGRTVEKIGIAGLSVKEIRQLVEGVSNPEGI
ncbi:MAG: NADP transhydrogenase subunit alpha [bacterium (Candidatus Ratteibacteria) CG23_combo_of_CG06-09_8_20_14_all_48_7]|uniref:NADP transhydrogenase subunit alpha n=1 Tax=bacterium (Candidatus Ratteibacteria) CG23_combo_of_CG06-09_8_20_14_all_48_7 TaxID=2014292 RepID=A0A2G9YAM3_9BACT|nr:MAG: NADP transhydrogenase subunit alpha [bacterium (Candidatus Ratteibacteria) CG23_combo_of_CG06-09_8_20_14_all_48_7]